MNGTVVLAELLLFYVHVIILLSLAFEWQFYYKFLKMTERLIYKSMSE